MHQLQLHLLFPLAPRNREVPNSRAAPAKLTVPRESQHHATAAAKGPGSLAPWRQQQVVAGNAPRATQRGRLLGPARAPLGPGWCGSTGRTPSSGAGPGAQLKDRLQECPAGKLGLQKGQGLAGQLTPRRPAVEEAPWRKG